MTQVDAKVLRNQIGFLKRHTRLISLSEVGLQSQPKDRRPSVLLTFDDGLRNNAEVVLPILRQERVPGVFFVCKRNTQTGSYLWFTYLYALERFFPGNTLFFYGERLDMTAGIRKETVARLRQMLLSLRPHPMSMYAAIERELPPLEEFISPDAITDCYAGMTCDQIKEISTDARFAVCSHTLDHPYLTMCEPDECSRQIVGSKRWLEDITGKPCDVIAYPAGDYNDSVVNECARAGMTDAYAVDVRVGMLPRLERPRLGIYRPSLTRLGIKIRWGTLLRRLHFSIG